MAEMKKKGRCWKGYKPKPGAKPYSKGSCIPEGANPVEDAEAADFGGKPLVKNPLRPKGDNLVRMKKKGKVKEATDEDRMRNAMEDEERMRKIKGKKPTPKALRRIPGTDKYVKEGAKEDYKKDDSDARAHDTFDRAEPFERRPYSHNSASTSDKHSFARDQGDSSRQRKKQRGSKESERSQDNRRKYLKSMLRRKRSNG